MGVAGILAALSILQLFSLQAFSSRELKVLKQSHDSSSLFPSNFLFGASSSAYQYEGGYLVDGKGLNNWDFATHNHPAIVFDGTNADVAVDQYHRYLEDIDLMVSLGINSYRLSISWARILPKGRFGDINMAGIDYYNKLIDALLREGIQPFVTLSHVDYPQELEDRYGSWLSAESQEDFGYYADVCFRHFGDRIMFWTTFNEPNFILTLSYQIGIFPPFRCSWPYGNCTRGDSQREPLIAAKNMILAHATAVQIYRAKYQAKQGGSIGYATQAMWLEPISNSTADKLAAERAQSFFMNWFLDPIIFGKYPSEMETILGPALPQFSRDETEKLKTGLDFIGVNLYSSAYVKDCLFSDCQPGRGGSKFEGFNEKTAMGEPTGMPGLNFYPQGLHKVLIYLKQRYNNTPVYITENGYGEFIKANSTIQELLHDVKRANAIAGYVDALQAAMREGADVRGYFVWSFLDAFEWLFGYRARYGLHHIDLNTLKRTPKLSATWYKNFISKVSSTNRQIIKKISDN